MLWPPLQIIYPFHSLFYMLVLFVQTLVRNDCLLGLRFFCLYLIGLRASVPLDERNNFMRLRLLRGYFLKSYASKFVCWLNGCVPTSFWVLLPLLSFVSMQI